MIMGMVLPETVELEAETEKENQESKSLREFGRKTTLPK